MFESKKTNNLSRINMIEIPDIVEMASGIKIFGKILKSFVFTTDVSVIKNTNADAVLAVYPFTPQPIITQALVMAADVPVFCGVGGGLTTGKRVVNLALDAEFKGAMGIVVNNPTSNDTIKYLRETIDIPIVVTVVSEYEDLESRISSGATILNVSGGKKTSQIIKKIREKYNNVPIIATGGRTIESIEATIKAGANAITYAPRENTEILKDIYSRFRINLEE